MTGNGGRTERSRRAFLRSGATASGAIALGLSGSETARAQDPGGKALMFNDEYRPGATFRVVSPVLEQTPDVDAVQDQSIWSGANTRAIEYSNTGERVLFFPVEDASVEQDRVYQFSRGDLSVFQDDEGIVSVGFGLPSDGERDADRYGDYQVVEGGGTALVAVSNFYPEALFRLVSGVVEWTPREDVQGSDVFADYNTRIAQYHNTSDEFLLHPAHAADVERGAVYVMRREFDVTEPEGELVTAQFDRVDEESISLPSTARNRSNATRQNATERTPGTTVSETETTTDGQPGFGSLLAGIGIGGGLLARELLGRRER